MRAVTRNTFVLVALDVVGKTYPANGKLLSVRYLQYLKRGQRVSFTRSTPLPLCRYGVCGPAYPFDARTLKAQARG